MEVQKMKGLKERPPCQLKVSTKCDGKALLVVSTNTGKMVGACHFCSWLKTHGVEWGPNGG